jgi:hypothetical protein
MDAPLVRSDRPLQQLALPFLVQRESLDHIFATAHRELRPRTAVPEIQVRFFPFAGINHTARLNQGRLTVRVSDLFDDAPAEIHRALALILLAKLYRKKIDPGYSGLYRTYILQNEIQERASATRTARGRGVRLTEAKGRHFDLESIFLHLNLKYFGGSLAKPQISWSAKRSRHILGRYDVSRHTVFISRVFDTPKVPCYVVEYVMFHEMLHIKHRTRVKDCRMIVHTPEFKQDERSFPQYSDAKVWLKGL